jgi:hypothetical protein
MTSAGANTRAKQMLSDDVPTVVVGSQQLRIIIHIDAIVQDCPLLVFASLSTGWHNFKVLFLSTKCRMLAGKGELLEHVGSAHRRRCLSLFFSGVPIGKLHVSQICPS